MTQTVQVKKEALKDLLKIKSDFDAVVESIELMSNKKFIASHKKAKRQIKKRQFDDWNEL